MVVSLSVHSYISLVAFIATIALVVTSPRIPIMFHFYNWYMERKNSAKQLRESSTMSEGVIEREANEKFDDVALGDSAIVEASALPPIGYSTTRPSIHHEDEKLQELQHSTTSLQQESPPVLKWHQKYLWYITLDVGTAPVLILLLLLCTTTLSPTILWRGVVGNEYLQPYTIVLLFMSLAYVCISLDTTFLFQYLAQEIVKRAKDSGKKLFVAFSVFTSILTVVTSNDIVILTVTPILCYTARQTKNLDPIPFVTTQFFLANVWSITLKIGNPTNIIVAEAYNFSFLNYFLWMALPAFVAGMSTFGLPYFIFRKQIPDKIELLHEDSSHSGTDEENPHENTEDDKNNASDSSHSMSVSLDKKMAILKSILLIVCLTSLATLTNIKAVRTWMICVGFGVLFLLIDLVIDLVELIRSKSLSLWWSRLGKRITWTVMSRMPWKIVPFVFSMFIIVELLAKYNLVSLLAQTMCKVFEMTMATGTELSFAQKLGSVSIMVFSISILSFLACNMMNNQPMTILFTTLLHDPSFVKLFSSSHKAVQQGAMLSLVVGSNLGANFTLIGALAGLLWIGILRDLNATKGMSSFTFTKYALCITPLVILFVSIVLVTELMIFG